MMVTISITDVDEPPLFTVPECTCEDNTSVTFDEVTGIDDDRADTWRNRHSAVDLDANNVGGWGASLRGYPWASGAPTVASSNLMLLLRVTTGPQLKFKAAPDFEKPADADKDNVYEVTITATDGNANMATRDVKVTVTNADEGGTVTLSQSHAAGRMAITASYGDPDGGLASATWQWWRTAASTLGADNAPPLPDDRSDSRPSSTDTDVWQIIEDATSATYKPVA